MTRKLWLSVAALVIVVGLVAFAGTAAASPTVAKKGGTLRVNLADADFEYVDPGLAYDTTAWSMLYSTQLMLLNFPDKSGPAGSKLYPEGAEAFPTISKDGKTYVYTVRKGLKFSDGSAVTAANFKRAIERTLSPKMKQGSPVGVNIGLDGKIVGATAFLDGKSQSISGVAAKGQKLTIKLVKQDPTFVSIMAMQWFGAVPANMPYSEAGLNTYASAGPYYIKARDIGKSLLLARNPNYKGSRPANPDQIVFNANVEENQSLLQVKNGDDDVTFPLPPASNESLGSQFGVNKQRYWAQPSQCVLYYAMNTTRAPFNNLAARKALEWGIDRPALVRVSGKYAGSRYDHMIPPGMAGYRNFHQYSIAGADPVLGKKVGGSAIKGTVNIVYPQTGSHTNRAQVLQFNLKQLGFDTKLSAVPAAVYFKSIGTKGYDFDVQYAGWCPDYNDPYDYLNVNFDGRSIQASNNVNYSYINSKSLNTLLDKANATTGDVRDSAYAALDKTLMKDYAPVAPFQNSNNRYFVSARAKNFIFQPYFGSPIFSALSVG